MLLIYEELKIKVELELNNLEMVQSCLNRTEIEPFDFSLCQLYMMVRFGLKLKV